MKTQVPRAEGLKGGKKMQETLKRTPEKKVTSQVYFLTVTAVLTALTYIFTAFINVRLPIAANGGLVHLGNVPLFLAAMICGRKTGMIAGGIGMGLFDLLSGWTMWAPFTLVIVGVMGYVMGAMTERHRTFRWRALAVLVVCVIKIVGYYLAEVLLYGNWAAPLSSIPGNFVQIAVAAVLVLPIVGRLDLIVKKLM